MKGGEERALGFGTKEIINEDSFMGRFIKSNPDGLQKNDVKSSLKSLLTRLWFAL